MIHVSVIVLAAGKGVRFGPSISKPLIKINSRPLIIYSLDKLSQNPQTKDIIVVANRANIKGIRAALKRYKIAKIKDVILGGSRRQDSVHNGLMAISRRTDLVLIHDAARPFINQEEISRVIKEAKRFGAAILGVPVRATVKKVTRSPGHQVTSLIVKKTINRGNLWQIQTPQVFKKDLILKAYKKFGHSEVTDDAMLVEKLGLPVRVVAGSYLNIKITTSEDLIIAKAILKAKNVKRKTQN